MRIHAKSLTGQGKLLRAGPILAICGSSLLTACATPAEPVVITQEVRIPIAVPCVDPDQIPPVREYADQKIKAPASQYEMVRALGLGLAERDEDLPVLRALLAGCVGEN